MDRFFWIVVAMTALGELATSLYTPHVLTMAKDFAVSAEWVQLSLAVNLLSFGASGFFYAPLSDAIGRRPIVLWGSFIFFVGSLMCFVAPYFWVLFLGRFIQGLGEGALTGLCLIVLRDRYKGSDLASRLSISGSIISLAPAIAPVMGGYLGTVTILGWRACFLFLMIWALVLWLVVYGFFPETRFVRQAFEGRNLLRRYKEPFASLAFLSYGIVFLLMLASWWFYLANAPFLLLDYYGLSRQSTGLHMSLPILFYAGGALWNRTLVKQYNLNTLMIVGLLITFGGGGLLAFYVPNTALGFMGFIAIPSFGAALVFTNVMALMLSDLSDTCSSLGAALINGLSLIMCCGVLHILPIVDSPCWIGVFDMMVGVVSLMALKFYVKKTSMS